MRRPPLGRRPLLRLAPTGVRIITGPGSDRGRAEPPAPSQATGSLPDGGSRGLAPDRRGRLRSLLPVGDDAVREPAIAATPGGSSEARPELSQLLPGDRSQTLTAHPITANTSQHGIGNDTATIYYDNDVIGTNTILSRERGKDKTRIQSSSLGDVATSLKLASAERDELQINGNDVQGGGPFGGRLRSEPKTCPKLGRRLTLECQVDAPPGGAQIQRFWWAKRHFDYKDGIVRDELLALNGRTYNPAKGVRVQRVGAGHQKLQIAALTSEDAGLYLCQASWGDDVAQAEVTVVLCR
ncbi:uncharacterized protein LOC119094442 [Pollicipes pollicipes]|uniref:uncharacterized protein LOC119094442 n=1 Tax=Pollicipes pollicipes TaxID=41117 RepID=UPI001884E29B|nr:uncharacterized protein LOC119094442 [Pollicipes pollicipes]